MKVRLAASLPAYVFIYIVCYYCAYLLRFDFRLTDQYVTLFVHTLPVVLLLKFLPNLATREWRRAFQYASIDDVFRVIVAASVAAALLYVANFIVFAGGRIPRSVILIDWTLTILCTGLMRISVRLYREQIRPLLRRQRRKRTLIYGSDEHAVGIMRTLKATSREFQVVGFVDESRRPARSFVAGVPVFGDALGWKQLSKKLRAQQVLIPGTAPGRIVREVVNRCAAANLKTQIIPTVPELVDGRYKLSVRDVTVSDLLRREPAQLDFGSIREYVTGKRVLVTGAAGSIGSELCRQIIDLEPAELVAVDQSEFGMFTLQQEMDGVNRKIPLRLSIADVANRSAMNRIFEIRRPQLVFHAAAYKHVPLMELNPLEAIRNNVLGTKVLVDLSGESGVERFVLISTDKAVRPSNVMGSTKLVSEKYVQAGSLNWETQFISVRFGNVLNSAGSVVPTFRDQIAAGGPLTVTHPQMERYFMIIPEAVQLVLQAGAVGSSGDVLILEMGEPVKIVDLAKDMICLSGLNYPDDIDIVFTGIRPGEKLREELFYLAEEGTKKVHDKIYCTSGEAPHPSRIHSDVNRLLDAVDENELEALDVLRKIVQKYVAGDRVMQPLKSAA